MRLDVCMDSLHAMATYNNGMPVKYTSDTKYILLEHENS